MEASVSLKKVGKLLDGRSVLAGLSFGIERGSIMALVGPNDAGKSTLLRVLAGVTKPEYGNVFINGMDVQLRPVETKRIVGYMPQTPNFDPQLTLRENFLFQGALYQLSDSIIKSQIAKLTNVLNIEDVLDQFPDELSQGYLKRAMLVRTLLHDPLILFLDEPTTSLDVRGKYMVWDFFQNLRGSKTIVYATQSVGEAERLHDRIMILHHGKTVLDGTLDRLLETTGELHHFQIHFRDLTDDMLKILSNISTVVRPERIGETFDFYGRDRQVLFDVMKLAIQSSLVDYKSEKVGLDTLLISATELLEE
ncbi:MAG: ABC transporter ATP-binding protein [Fidelibacterota bacterium]